MTVVFDPSPCANALQMPWQRVLVIIQATLMTLFEEYLIS